METLGLARQGQEEGKAQKETGPDTRAQIHRQERLQYPPPTPHKANAECTSSPEGFHFCGCNNIQVKMFACMCMVESRLACCFPL